MLFNLTIKHVMVDLFLFIQRAEQGRQHAMKGSYPVLHAVDDIDFTLLHDCSPLLKRENIAVTQGGSHE